MVGTGRSAHGILFRAPWRWSKSPAWTPGLDKTGTSTQGRPARVRITALGAFGRSEALALAAAVEAQSEHPLAGAVVAAARSAGLAPPSVERFSSIPGMAPQAGPARGACWSATRACLEQEGVRLRGAGARADQLAGAGLTVVFVAVDGVPAH